MISTMNNDEQSTNLNKTQLFDIGDHEVFFKISRAFDGFSTSIIL